MPALLGIPLFRLCTAAFLCGSLLLSGCSLPDPGSSSDNDAQSGFPQTSVVADREDYLNEALNPTAKALKKSTKKKWKRKPYQKAVRSILEQCVIDGYISDVSGSISMQVIYTPSGTALDTSGIASASGIEGDIVQIAEDVAATHGISVEITSSSSDNTPE